MTSRPIGCGLVLLTLAAITTGCGPLTLDASNAVKAENSARKMRDPMTEPESARFDEALFYLAGVPWLGRTDDDRVAGAEEMERLVPLDGRTAEGIVAEARRRRLSEVRSGMRALEAIRDESAAQRRELSAFHFGEARVFKIHRDYLEWPVIEFRIENRTNFMVSMVDFRTVLFKPGDHRVWLSEDFELVFFDGLAPGEKDRWRVEPEQQEWIQLADPHPDLEFVIEPMRLLARGGGVLSASDWGVVEERRLASYESTLRTIRSSDTLALDQPPLPSLPPLSLDEIVGVDSAS